MIPWKYTLTFQTPASVFSGMAAAGLIDRMVIRDHDGMPYIPGSSVKGRLRFFAERMLKGGHASLPGIRMHQADHPQCKKANSACTICKIFGNPAIPSMLWVGQAYPEGEAAKMMQEVNKIDRNPVFHHDAEIRPGIAVSRHYRTALPDHLFFDEAIPPVIFQGRIMVKGDLTPGEKRFFMVAGQMVDAVGGRKAVGRGILKNGVELVEIIKREEA